VRGPSGHPYSVSRSHSCVARTAARSRAQVRWPTDPVGTNPPQPWRLRRCCRKTCWTPGARGRRSSGYDVHRIPILRTEADAEHPEVQNRRGDARAVESTGQPMGELSETVEVVEGELV
jgi:hypothetical protein